MFRHERPQKGRLRQFHQMDIEVLGASEPEVDAELMAMGSQLLTGLGIRTSLEINSLGCPQCRPAFRQRLIDYLDGCVDGLCDDCKRRKDSNPLRVIDCKKPNCRSLVENAPSILDSLCPDCSTHFGRVRAAMDLLQVEYRVNHFMVRGLDYYCRTTFEFLSSNLGSQSAVGAGGRYDGLIEQLGGPAIPGIGFAIGMERLILLMQEETAADLTPVTDLFIATLGDQAMEHGMQLTNLLRQQGLRAAMDYSGRSLKAQMKQAGRSRAAYALIIGDSELETQTAVLRDMAGQQQEELSLGGSTEEQVGRLCQRIKP
jgi:histidyl-tRNA synthetase